MNDKQILDRLESINLSLRQKKDLIDVIKDIAGSNSSGGNGSNDNDSLDNNKLYVYMNNIEHKVLINDIEYEFSESTEEASITIKNETLYNYIKNYFDKNYYAYITTVYKRRNDIVHMKIILNLSHIISGDNDCFDIVFSYIDGYYALIRIIK